MTAIVSLRSITHRFQVMGETLEPIRDLSLEIRSGESLAISGASGSGKSTLLHIIGLLENPTMGAYHFAGRDVSRLSDDEKTYLRNHKIGFVFQTPWMIGHLSVSENVSLPLLLRGQKRRLAHERAQEELAQLGLADLADRSPDELSSGQLQLATIARALTGDPDLILADEATASLDPQSEERALALLQRRTIANEVTLILVTHDESQARRMKRRLVLGQNKSSVVGNQLQPGHLET